MHKPIPSAHLNRRQPQCHRLFDAALKLCLTFALGMSLASCATAGEGSDNTPDARAKNPDPGPDAGTDIGASPYGVALYLRGTFNDYGLENAMTYDGQNRYTTELSLSAGSHEFKIADADYGDETTFAVDGSRADAIQLDMPTTLQLAVGIDNNVLLFVPQTGTYRFELSAVDRTNPVLLVSQGAPAPYSTTLYLRGTFNEFDTSLPLSYIGQGRYRAVLALPTGAHELKIADASYSEGTTFSVDAANATAISIGTSSLLVSAIGENNNTLLDVTQTGLYEFTLDANSPATPSLLISQTEVAPFENGLYLRGNFNEFDTSAEMVFQGQSRYVGTVLLDEGSYAFKIADEGFSAGQTFSIEPSQGNEIAVGENTIFIATPQGGTDTDLAITKPALYEFELNASNPSAPVLQVRVGVAAPYARSIYLHGTFNGPFSQIARMDYLGDNLYAAVITIDPDTYEFKIADTGFSDASTFSADADSQVPILLTIPTKLVPAIGQGNNALFEAAESGAFRFELDAETPAAPILLITEELAAPIQ